MKIINQLQLLDVYWNFDKHNRTKQDYIQYNKCYQWIISDIVNFLNYLFIIKFLLIRMEKDLQRSIISTSLKYKITREAKAIQDMQNVFKCWYSLFYIICIQFISFYLDKWENIIISLIIISLIIIAISIIVVPFVEKYFNNN